MKNKLFRIAKKLELPDALFGDGGCIEIIDNSRAIIENVVSILEYENERVRINLGKRMVIVEGYQLTLSDYTGHIIVINGNINRLWFE